MGQFVQDLPLRPLPAVAAAVAADAAVAAATAGDTAVRVVGRALGAVRLQLWLPQAADPLLVI